MTADLSFITNQNGENLSERLKELIKDSRFFDCLVGYFYISGFHLIKDALQNTEKIRILVGLGVSESVYSALNNLEDLSEKQIKEEYSGALRREFENSPDEKDIEIGVKDFIDLIRKKRLEIRIYPENRLHAKVYILTFKEGDRDVGRVITGSSNLTYSGLVDNLEFNVELKNRADYEFAKQKFEELWEEGIDITPKVVDVIEKETWLNNQITPYELYLKFLYEYFIDDLNAERYLTQKYLPSNYIEFEFQTQAILNAKKIIQAYGGCFISDVVGLGKTYTTARLISELGGRTIVIAPPKLIERSNPGSWKNVFADFNIPAEFFSVGKLDDALEEVSRRNYDNVVIDEAHRFRNELTVSYEKLAQICRGKRVILVTATPYNNYPSDLLNQIALFQNRRKSTIPGILDLEMFFNRFENRLKRVNKKNNYNEYLKIVRENSKEIRDKCLKYIMVRRTRREIEKYFSKDLERNNIKFPEVLPPKPLFYQMNKKLDKIFMDTVKLITQALTYARYMPLLYLKDQTRLSSLAMQSQENMGRFMKVLLVKRLESSFHAFRKTIERFIESYKTFIKIYEKGKVYLSKNYSQKILEYLNSDNFEEIEKLIEEGKAQEYDASEFNEELIKDLKNDLDILQKIKDMWDQIDYDPKLKELIYQLKRDEILKNNKVIIFTESRETAEYLKEQIEAKLKEKPLLFTSTSSERDRDEVIENFDARAKEPKDDYRILISTEVLSEGVNLHRANVVINYDIPWNPTRLMQRVGRINRVDTKHDKIYTYNFFPSSQADNEIELTEIARSKIEAFFTLLGGDSAILTDGEPVESHELFDKLMSVSTLTGEDESEESELKYLRVIEDIRDNNTDLFNKIKRLPKKARSSKDYESINLDQDETKDLIKPDSLLTFFRKGKLTKFYLSDGIGTYELDFITTAKILESSLNEPLGKINLDVYYELLMKNKEAFINATEELDFTLSKKRGKDSSKELLKVLKFLQNNSQKFTDKEEELVTRIIDRLNEGAIPQRTIKETLKRIRDLNNDQEDPIKVLNVIKNSIPQVFLSEAFIRPVDDERERREIILSLYIGGK